MNNKESKLFYSYYNVLKKFNISFDNEKIINGIISKLEDKEGYNDEYRDTNEYKTYLSIFLKNISDFSIERILIPLFFDYKFNKNKKINDVNEILQDINDIKFKEYLIDSIELFDTKKTNNNSKYINIKFLVLKDFIIYFINDDYKKDIKTLFNENIIHKTKELDKQKSIIDKLELLDEITKKIHDYLDVSESEKKFFGEVFTPFNIIEEMLDTLPKEVWSNPDLKWLDPANGVGNFPIVIVKRLMNGLKEKIPDEEKRYKHIMENMIYVCDINGKNMWIYLNLFDKMKKRNLNMNYFKGSFLTEEFDKKMKEEWNIDKFDIIVGNPPFNQNIDLKFIKKSYKISDKVLFIHPSTWLLDEKNKQKRFTSVKDLIGNNLKLSILFNGNPVFGIGLFVPCSITYIEKENKEKIKVIDKINDKEIEYDNIYDINKFHTPEYLSLKEKIENHGDYINNYLNRNLNYWVNLSQIRGNVNINDINNSSLVKKDFYTLCPIDLKVEKKKLKNNSWSFVSENEAENFLNYVKTKFVRFCLSIYKNNGHLNRGEINLIPWLDFTQEWDDKKLCEYFNITDKEWEFIDNVIPDYY